MVFVGLILNNNDTLYKADEQYMFHLSCLTTQWNAKSKYCCFNFTDEVTGQ